MFGLVERKNVSNFYQPYDELEYNYNEDDDDQSEMVNVFAWNKAKFGCYTMEEHFIDNQGFPC